jgi:hypothetical protein
MSRILLTAVLVIYFGAGAFIAVLLVQAGVGRPFLLTALVIGALLIGAVIVMAKPVPSGVNRKPLHSDLPSEVTTLSLHDLNPERFRQSARVHWGKLAIDGRGRVSVQRQPCGERSAC